MSTIDDKALIDKLITQHGYYETDPRVFMIVEYINAYGRKTWGVTWINEHPSRRRRYTVESQYVSSPRIIWSAENATN